MSLQLTRAFNGLETFAVTVGQDMYDRYDNLESRHEVLDEVVQMETTRCASAQMHLSKDLRVLGRVTRDVGEWANRWRARKYAPYLRRVVKGGERPEVEESEVSSSDESEDEGKGKARESARPQVARRTGGRPRRPTALEVTEAAEASGSGLTDQDREGLVEAGEIVELEAADAEVQGAIAAAINQAVADTGYLSDYHSD